MNVLIVNRALGMLFGGGESFDLNAARHLQKRGHKIKLITGKPYCRSPNNLFPDLDVVYLSVPDLRRFSYATERFHRKLSAVFYHLDNYLFEKAVERWISDQDIVFDVVQCCSLFNLPIWLLSKKRRPMSVISWLPGPPSGLVRSRLSNLRLNPHFGLFTHGTTEWALVALDFVKGVDFQVVEPGVDIDAVDSVVASRPEMYETLGLDRAALLGVTTARLVPVKNHALLLDAIAIAKKRGVVWNWLVIGNGPTEQSLKAQAGLLGIASQIHFLGYRAQSEVHRWLSVADVFVLTSFYESFSIATLEAMAHRLPVVSTKVGYLEKLIGDSGGGMLVPPNESDALADALIEMASSQVRSKFGSGGRNFAERLDWPKIAEELDKFYLRIIQGRIF